MVLALTAVSTCLWALPLTSKTLGAASKRAISFNCRYSMGRVAKAMLAYAEENDDRLPPADRWNEALAAANPRSGIGDWARIMGFAMFRRVAGRQVKSIRDPGTTPLLFDSTIEGRNPTGGLDTLPSPPRHGTTWPWNSDPPHNNIAYLDGHVAAMGPAGPVAATP